MSDVNRPLISVIISTSGEKDALLNALDSIDKQTYPAIELIVLNDNSDESAVHNYQYLCSNWFPQSIRCNKLLFLNTYQLSFSEAIQSAIQISSGQYLSFLMSNESYASSRLEFLMDGLQAHNREWGFTHINFSSVSPAFQSWFYEDFSKGNPIGFSLLHKNLIISLGNLIFSRSLYEKIGGLCGDRRTMAYDFAFKAIIYAEPFYDSRQLFNGYLNENESNFFMLFHQTSLYKLFCQLYVETVSSIPPNNTQAPCRKYGPREYVAFEKRYQKQRDFKEDVFESLRKGKGLIKISIKFLLKKLSFLDRVKNFVRNKKAL